MFKAKLREERRLRDNRKINEILMRGGGNKELNNALRGHCKRITEIQDHLGRIRKELDEIADAFALFYEELYGVMTQQMDHGMGELSQDATEKLLRY